ncbi:hypothetical protein [Hymenobacter perfusus]|uniref:Uncharacterized protein n=1 Tax=Hymenobacter perfusus TaxID=1236770 RepID=A0A428JXG9_9BACT|nr:hypothetical protein [Hymenobacter perfusus]RSK38823.1 hypothetical protein EI293_21260 [Hymenobacter perfusus]
MPNTPPLPPNGPVEPSAPRRFTDLLRNGRYQFTERELMEHLRMTYRTIKQREAEPSTLTVAELLRVADLLDEPVQSVIAVVLAEVQANAQTVVDQKTRAVK